MFRVNTTFAAEERGRAAQLGTKYTSTKDMLSWVTINAGHYNARACQQEGMLQRLYVATQGGLLTYDTGVEPFGRSEANGALCSLDEDNGPYAIDIDMARGVVFATTSVKDGNMTLLHIHSTAS